MYYLELSSVKELLGENGLWGLPAYAMEEYIVDENRKINLNMCLSSIARGHNILIVGSPGTGKTAFMAYLLRLLKQKGTRVGVLLDNAVNISREHEDEGIVLFYDDLMMLSRDTLRSIFTMKIKNIVATLRMEDMPIIESIVGQKIEDLFKIIRVGKLSEDSLRLMTRKYAFREGVEICDEDAVDIVCRKADGLPVYIWQAIRDLKILGKCLDKKYADQIPKGMLKYVDNILWRVIGNSPEKYNVLPLLLIMTDLPRYSAHFDLFYALYVAIKEHRNRRKIKIEDAIFSDSLDMIMRYLLVDKEKHILRIPHDSWVDVLKGESTGLLSPEIKKTITAYPKEVRQKILLAAIRKIRIEIMPRIEDPTRKRTLKKFIRKISTTMPLLRLQTKYRREDIIRLQKIAEDLKNKLLSGQKLTAKECEKALVLIYSTTKFKYLEIATAIIVKYSIQTGDEYYLNAALRKLEKTQARKVSYNIGIYFFKNKKFREAKQYFNKALKYGYGLAHLALALIDILEAHPDMAEWKLEKYLKTTTNKDLIQKLLAIISKLTISRKENFEFIENKG